MSLVEKALQKMQASDRARKPTYPVPPAPVGQVVAPSRGVRRAEPASPPRVLNPEKLVKVDRDALRATGLLPQIDQEREFADQYRAIKRPLIQTAFYSEPPVGSPPPQLIMIGSALPGDGKTFTGINLAFSMAREKDHSVILVDGDVIKPHVSNLFGIDKEPGLLDALANPAIDITSLVLPTDIPGLSLLPSGVPTETATELLASDRMAQIVQQLSQINPRGIVLFDSLPILLTSEARVLTTLMGQIVLVVKAGATTQQAVTDALAAIGPDRKVWLVLNQAELSGPAGYYYGYRYGSRSQGQAGDEAEEARAAGASAAGGS